MEKTYADSITSEAVNLLPTGSFPGEIVVVDRSELIADACAYLSECDVIGFDTETRPSFTKGVMNKVSLLQLSSGERAFLFRLNRIALEKPLLQLLSSDRVVKAGVAIRDDIRVLRQLRHFTPGGFVELQNIAPEYGITDKSLRKLAAIVLSVRISKAQRLSNWEAKQLTPAQQLYAATDAWIGREIYLRLKRSGEPGPRPYKKKRTDRDGVRFSQALFPGFCIETPVVPTGKRSVRQNHLSHDKKRFQRGTPA